MSQFGDGLFAAGLAGAILFNPERAAGPWAIAGSFAVLYLPYSLLGPFAGALLDRWDRRLVLVCANLGRLLMILAVAALLGSGAEDRPILIAALIVNGFSRFVSSGLSASLPHVVPREQVVPMNSVATATGGGGAGSGRAGVLPAAPGAGCLTPAVVVPAAARRWGRYATANGALALAAVIQLAASGLQLPMMLACGFLLGMAGQVVKLCADSA